MKNDILELKGKILKIKDYEEFYDFADDYLEKLREKFLNCLLEDNEICNHVCKIFNSDKKTMEHIFVINGCLPLDNDLED